MRTALLALFVLAVASPTWAQSRTPTLPVEGPVPSLSELETAQFTILALRSQLDQAIREGDKCRAALSDGRGQASRAALLSDLDDFKAKVAASHPGFVLDPEKGVLVPLVKPER